ncbi:MAG: hypothetical protein ACQEP9_09705 [Bacillota bacterium]
MSQLKLETNTSQQPAVLRENAPLIIIILSIFILGTVAIGLWHYFEINTSEQTVNAFENKVDGLVKNVSGQATNESESETDQEIEMEEKEDLAAQSNPFQSPLQKQEKSDENSSTSKTESENDEPQSEVKKRIGDKVRVLGLLGGPGKRLAIIGIGSDVQIVKPGDRISSLTIKDINQERVLAEEYDEELTYTFGGGQD